MKTTKAHLLGIVFLAVNLIIVTNAKEVSFNITLKVETFLYVLFIFYIEINKISFIYYRKIQLKHLV